MNESVCHLCYPNAIEIGCIAYDLYLIAFESKYHIISGQGHSGDIILSLDKIYPDDDSDEWLENIFRPVDKLKFDPKHGYKIIKEAVSLGFDINENFTDWVINKMISLVGAKK